MPAHRRSIIEQYPLFPVGKVRSPLSNYSHCPYDVYAKHMAVVIRDVPIYQSFEPARQGIEGRVRNRKAALGGEEQLEVNQK